MALPTALCSSDSSHMQRRLASLLLSGLLLACHAAASPVPSADVAPQREPLVGHLLKLPQRAGDAPTGSAFAELAISLRPGEREQAIVAQILAGNVPDFERRLVPVDLTAHGAAGQTLRGRVFVLPDYLAVGSDADFVRVPMTVRAARKIARETGCVLPTTHIVDAIHAAARAHVSSPYMTPGDQMASVEYFVAHNRVIEERRAALAIPLGALLSGPKKDLVITSRMLETPRRTPIYGWFNPDGSVIQTLSLVHDDHYVDYAHGVRLVDGEMEVEGASVGLLDTLATRERAALISSEGAFDLRFVWAKGW